jgi:quercetin dioxygenase-like cupin family protein
MELALMKKVFRIADIEPFETLPSGHTAWLLTKVGNLSAVIFETKQEAELPSSYHQEEEFIYVLQGGLAYDDGRVAKASEAVFNLPAINHPGRYNGRLLCIRAFPEPGKAAANKDLMREVMRKESVKTFYDARIMSTRRLWAATETFSIVTIESQPGSTFQGIKHPEKEILYLIQGHLEYEDGRVIKDGEAVVNLPDMPHSVCRKGTRLTISLEAKAPADPKILDILRMR